MENKNFWNDAAKYGAILALASIAFTVVGMFVTNGAIAFTSLVVYVLLLYFFTKRRATRCGGGEEGFSYGRGLQFILCMALFAGILGGAYEIAAANWLFTARYDEMMGRTVALLDNMGFYSRDQIDMMSELAKSLMHSPLYLLFSGVLSSLIKGLFFGLFVAGFTRRNPDVFAGNNE